MASFDLTQAFYRIDRSLLEELLFQRLEDKRIACQLRRRLDKVVYRLSQGTTILELEAPLGVVVGDSLGPLLFVIYMDGFARDLQEQRDAARWPKPLRAKLRELAPSWRAQLQDHLAEVVSQRELEEDLSDIIYADDHDVFRPVDSWREVRQEIELVRAAHQRWKMTVNLAKSSVMVQWHGPGAKPQRGKRPRGVILTNGEIIPLVAEQTHLGAVRTRSGAAEATIKSRCNKAACSQDPLPAKDLGQQSHPPEATGEIFQGTGTANLVLRA